MSNKRSHPHGLAGVLSAIFLGITPALAAPPDLTSGGTIPENLDTTWNLGPTGMRGWVFYDTTSGGINGSVESRQIQVREVDAGSPADGFFLPDDLILGASGTATAPVSFEVADIDARRGLAAAIAEAEAQNPAELQLIRWRAGVQDVVTLTLRTMGAYTATAPYTCPKSEKILEEGMDYYYNNESSGRYRMGVLSLLAAQDDFFPAPDRALYLQEAETEARALIKSASELQALRDYTASTSYSAPWGRVHELILLGEYYLITSDLGTADAQVYPTIEALAINIAKGISHYGTMGHSLRSGGYDASNPYRPANTGYGVINSLGMPALLGVQLAKQCGVSDPAIDQMIDRAKMFYASYANRGAIPYGEHEAYDPRHENNGKSGMAAIALDNDPTYESQAEFFVMMALASGDSDRDVGHTGAYFNYLWAPLGVQRGGPSAVQEYFKKISWMLDLHRRWDGGFDYDSYSENRAPNGGEYNNFRMSAAVLLTYALPLESLHITGRDSTGALALSAGQITDSLDVEDYDASARTTAELVADLAVWSPKVRLRASEELGNRTIDTATRDDLRAKALDVNGSSRYGAIQAIGETDDTGFTGDLVSLLNDDDAYLRTLAAKALHKFHGSHKVPYRASMMATLVSRDRLSFPVDPVDPLQLDEAALITAIFGGGAFANNRSEMDTLISEVGSTLFFDALKVAATSPTGNARGRINNILKVLTPAEVALMAPELVDMVSLESPADRMFSLNVRNEAMLAMARSLVADAVPAAMQAMDNSNSWGGFHDNMLNGLIAYDGSSTLVTPDPDVVAFANRYLTGGTAEEAQALLDAIDADTNPTTPLTLKTIDSATADDPTVDITSNTTTLRVTANDLAQGDSLFTWTKIQGPGAVTFTPNGTSATTSNVLFDGTQGTYQFEVTMSDSRGLTEAYETVTVNLANSSAPDVTPPSPDPMTWASVPTATSSTAITMTATTATDSSEVEYFFDETSGNPGGTDSPWQDSPIYIDSGLTPDTTYTYTVTARDKSPAQNTSAPSGAASETPSGAPPTGPLKVFILAGQSNMEGHGEMNPAFSQGTLDYLVANDPATYGHLKVGANWATWDDVWISYKRGGTTLLNGDLSAGYGVQSTTIGPELQFGVELGNYLGEQVLLIKTAWGGKSLYVDFRPPTSGWSVNPPVAAGDQGYWYQQMLSDVSDALANLSTYFPDYATIGSYELAGFGWHQGWNDRVNSAAVAEYEANMENFIIDVRSDLGAIHPSGANLPFVIATTGIGGPNETGTSALALMNAQLAMEDFVKYPAFDGNVAVVDTREFWREASESPADQGFHWNRNAETYFLIGQSMATHMRVLLDGGDTTPPTPSPMTWATTPIAAGEGEITMTATTATDIIGVEYFFEETSGNLGGDDSGWQNSPTYLDTGLSNSTSYSYRVKARDKSPDQNETAWSSLEPATTTPADTTAPTPSPMTWAIAPTALSSRVITMTATTASDPSGVEYYFTNTTISGHDSGWQDSPKYTDAGLEPSTSYTYEVKARDKSMAANETAPSAGTVGTTMDPPPPGPLIYEPFDDLDPTLNGNTPGLGLSGTWSAASVVTPGSLAYGDLATSGGRVTTGGGQFQENGISPGTTLTNAGLMVDGSTLWFSVLMVNYNSVPAPTTDNRTYLALGTGNADGFDRIGGTAGSGFTVAVSKVSPGGVTAQAWNDGSDGTGGATRGSTVTVANDATFLAVGKITWGEFGVEDDVFELYLPGTDLVQGSLISTISADFDQLGVADPANAFDTISVTGGRPDLGVPEFDEIRFGATYADVVVSTSSDTTAPTLAGTDIVDNVSGGPISNSTPVVYTVTFSEAMNASTISTTDFENGGSPAASITGVTPTGNPAVFEVSVTPGGDGTLILQVAAGANLEDLAGNVLDTTAAIADDTTISVVTSDTTPPTLAGTDIVDAVSGGPILESTAVTYTVTFSEAMNASTISTSDFENGGSASAAITSVTPVNASTYEVLVNPGGPGTLILQIAAGANLEDLAGNALDTASAIVDDTVITVEADTTKPTPDPMTWAAVPAATSNTAITMTASTASDLSGVEYFFTNTTISGHDSGWQDSPTYIDIGLDPATTYSYQVRARDKSSNNNETGLSPLESATTDAGPTGALIYEPFADLNSTLSGNTPGLGLSGPWSAESLIADRSLSYGKLGYQGGRAVANPGIGNGVINNEISPGTTLTGAGLMADGAELWFSVLIVKHPDTSITTDERTTYFSLGTGVADAFDRIGGGGGSGFTFVVNQGNNGISDRLQLWNNDSDGAGGAEKRSPLGVSWGPEGSTLLLVGKITWGAFDPNPGTAIDNDVFELYVPDKDLNLGSVVATLTGNFDQLGTVDPANAFDTISFAGKRGGTAQNNVPEIDEFRFGATSADVLPLDFADPLLVSTDNASGSGVARVATFDEELYVGTGDIRIVNETTPGTTTITLPDPQVVLSDRTLTITPTVPLSDDTYHIEIDAGALTDRNLNEFAGISDPDLWEFTVDGSPPTVATFVEDTFPLISGISPGQVLTNSSLTYTVTFSEPIDAGTVEIADFAASAGSAPATVDSVTATNDPAVFEVGVSTGGTTGTLTLEIVASAVIADVNGLELDTTTAIPSDNTVNVVDPVANAASLTNDFQGTIASQLNDLAVTDPPGGEGRYFHVSVNEDNAGTGWYCADLPGTGDPAPDGVRNFTGPVVAYKMLGNGSLGDVTTTAGSGGDDGRITYATDDPTFTNDGFGQQQMKLWTTNDPGADLATGAGKDATGNAFVGNYGYRDWKGATGIVDISGMASGSVHIYYGAYGDTPTLKVTLKDADNVGADLVIADAHSIADGGNGDAANNCEYYLAEVDFVSDGVYDVIIYEWSSSNGRGLGTVLTGPAVAADPFVDWAATGTLGPVTFDGDTNGDGVQDGLAFLLGAADPDVDANAAGLLPTVTETAGGLVLDFDCLPIADRGNAKLYVQHSNDLGTWTTSPTGVEVPDADAGPTSNVTFTVTPGSPLNSVTATIDSGAAAGGKLFGRLQATE